MAALSNIAQVAKRLLFASEAAHSQKRLFWQWLNAVFNRYDQDRIKEIGPDRAAAEWLIRSGASVRWSGAIKFHTDYNTLPTTSSSAYKIEEIDATDSSIMEIGFPYLKELTHLKSINLTRCNFLGDKALQMLQLRKDSLEKVHVISCGNVTDAGVKSLSELAMAANVEKNEATMWRSRGTIDADIAQYCRKQSPFSTKLQYLELFDLPGVRDREGVLQHFSQLLPTCKVDYPEVNKTTEPKK